MIYRLSISFDMWYRRDGRMHPKLSILLLICNLRTHKISREQIRAFLNSHPNELFHMV